MKVDKIISYPYKMGLSIGINMKFVIFDLDGVLVEAKEIHYEALNEALGEKYMITWDEHLSRYDGLKTSQKLEMLTKDKDLPVELYEEVWRNKQKLTIDKLRGLSRSEQLIECMASLTNDGYKIAVCSNSIRKTVLIVLSKLGIIEYIDLIVSNEDVKNSKPHPEMYWKAISKMSFLPEQTLIVEDSPYGLLAAARSKSHVLRVKSPDEVSYSNIIKKIKEIKIGNILTTPKWKNEKLNILIPMAGAGSRFEQAGYTFPKPLIEVNGKPMIQVVVENLNMDANYIYVVQKSHREKYNLDTMLNLITPGCKIVEVDGITEGAACTALLAKDFINSDSPLFFANSDQFVEWDSNEFMYKMPESNCDGGIVTFKATHPKWSFAKIDENGFITEVAEKNPISDNATVGYYYWKHGSDFIRYAEQMIERNIRVNNEFYVCPVFNQAIEDCKKIRIFESAKMWGLGTPEDLNFYLENHRS
jgi:HAD superfamily hydrolase (TIGR01509 family)